MERLNKSQEVNLSASPAGNTCLTLTAAGKAKALSREAGKGYDHQP
jgi:hypothetical protein